MRPDATREQEGFVLIAALALLSLTFLLGALLMGMGALEMAHSAAQYWGRGALCAAEGGLERARVRLLTDWLDSRSWRDGMIGELYAPVCEDGWGELLGWTDLREERYRVLYRHVPRSPRQMLLRAQGKAGAGRGTRHVEALFQPLGGPGTLTVRSAPVGPVSVCGSCWIWGDGVQGTALELGPHGTRNHYGDLPGALRQHIPDCPTRVYNGELVQSLCATLWVRSGGVVGRASTLGEPDLRGNEVQELLDGIFCGGALPEQRYTVREARAPEGWPDFPSLGSGYPCGGGWGSYRDCYRRGGEAPVWQGDLRLSPPLRDGSFGSQDGDSLVWWSRGGMLTVVVAGNIEVDGSLIVGAPGRTMRYMGQGHIHCGGHVLVEGDVLPANLLGEEDLLGISADGDVTIRDQGRPTFLGVFVHTDGCFLAHGEVHVAGSLIADGLISPAGSVFYEVPAVSARLCCSRDRWLVSCGNTRREAYSSLE